ncbi:MAG: glucose-6-phosphate dehydrogenase, partial [Microbacterium sp.]|nr:glucose-6-phosphate dehydrogenase [Microbacterium sp.]
MARPLGPNTNVAVVTDDTTLVIFGATGDLTSRLVLPALAQLLDHEPHRKVRVIGAGRGELSDSAWRSRVRKAFGDERSDAANAVLKSSVYRQADPTDESDLKSLLSEIEGRAVLYFAVPPQVAQQACEQLEPGDLPEGTVLALEKPFGSDQESARRLNAALRRLVPENRIFRVDHFLGRSTTLNLLGVRFANRIFEPVWSAEHIESVVIRFDESLGLEDRAAYYDDAGALVDMIQSHLLQVMAIVAMQPPASLHEADLRDATTAALRATVTFEVRTSRWAGVPFTLRSGKAIGRPMAEIVLTFRPVRHLPAGFTGAAPGSELRFSLGPDAISLGLNVNGGEDPFALERRTVEAPLGEGALRAYAEVLSSILDGDAALAVRGD